MGFLDSSNLRGGTDRLEDVIRRVISKKKDYKELRPGRGGGRDGSEIFGSQKFLNKNEIGDWGWKQ